MHLNFIIGPKKWSYKISVTKLNITETKTSENFVSRLVQNNWKLVDSFLSAMKLGSVTPPPSCSKCRSRSLAIWLFGSCRWGKSARRSLFENLAAKVRWHAVAQVQAAVLLEGGNGRGVCGRKVLTNKLAAVDKVAAEHLICCLVFCFIFWERVGLLSIN